MTVCDHLLTRASSFNGFPILTLEDDHSRKGWALRLEDAKDDRVVYGMEDLHPGVYENLLTDNGKQFARNNSTMRKYCESYPDWKAHLVLGAPSVNSGEAVGGWYGLKNGLRGRFAMYVPPVMEGLGIAEVVHNPKNNRIRAK